MAEPTPRQAGFAPDDPKPCGECSLCCKLLVFRGMEKPANVWCSHVVKGKGCGIHAERPLGCRDFFCLWSFATPLGENWRPDRCKFVMRPGPTEEVVIDVDPGFPNAWKEEPFYSQIKTWSVRRLPPHRMVIVRSAGRLAVVFPEGEIDLGPERPYDPISSGYVLRKGKQTPYAHYGVADAAPE